MIDSMVVGALATNCYLVPLSGPAQSVRPCLVVDPGGDAELIITRLKRRRWRPSLIVLTHGHFDHCGALAELYAHFAQEGDPPLIAIQAADASYLGPESSRRHLADFRSVGITAQVADFWQEPPPADRLLSEADPVASFSVLLTPGHSPGSICLYDEQAGILLSGDTLFANGIGRSDLPNGDGVALNRSLNRLLALPGQTKVLAGHGPASRISDCIRCLRWS